MPVIFFFTSSALSFSDLKSINIDHIQLHMATVLKGLGKRCRKRDRSSHCGSVEMNPTSILENVGLVPGLAQWVRNLVMLCAVV